MNWAPNIFTLDYHILNRLVVMFYTTKCDQTFLAFPPGKLTIQGIFRATGAVWVGNKSLGGGDGIFLFVVLIKTRANYYLRLDNCFLCGGRVIVGALQMAWALLYILSILASHCEEEMVWARVWLARRNSNKSITAWSITRDIKYTTHYLQHSQDLENSSKQNFLHHLYLGSDLKVAQIMVQRHLAAIIGVTCHWFASLLSLVWAPDEIEGLSFVMILVLAAVEALVSANIRSFSFILTTH